MTQVTLYFYNNKEEDLSPAIAPTVIDDSDRIDETTKPLLSDGSSVSSIPAGKTMCFLSHMTEHPQSVRFILGDPGLRQYFLDDMNSLFQNRPIYTLQHLKKLVLNAQSQARFEETDRLNAYIWSILSTNNNSTKLKNVVDQFPTIAVKYCMTFMDSYMYQTPHLAFLENEKFLRYAFKLERERLISLTINLLTRATITTQNSTQMYVYISVKKMLSILSSLPEAEAVFNCACEEAIEICNLIIRQVSMAWQNSPYFWEMWEHITQHDRSWQDTWDSMMQYLDQYLPTPSQETEEIVSVIPYRRMR